MGTSNRATENQQQRQFRKMVLAGINLRTQAMATSELRHSVTRQTFLETLATIYGQSIDDLPEMVFFARILIFFANWAS